MLAVMAQATGGREIVRPERGVQSGWFSVASLALFDQHLFQTALSLARFCFGKRDRIGGW